MNILFITIGRLDSIFEKEIYPDLMRQLVNDGNNITVLRFSSEPNDKKKSGPVYIYNKCLKGIRGNVSTFHKGVAYLRFPLECIRFIEKMPKYDLVVSSTPPVTVSFVFCYLKRKKIPTYLLQKDIFPEDAIDLGILSKRGLKGLIYNFFRYCENRLYKNSCYIGAMSEACVEYLVKHNKNVDSRKFEVNPNSIIPSKQVITEEEKERLRVEFNLPKDKIIYVYGGNVSDAQGIEFIDKVLEKVKNANNELFLFLGEGRGLKILREKYAIYDNILFRPSLSSKEYYRLVGCCDIGLVFLSSKLRVPNVPSRMLFYMDNSLPILAAVDKVSDIYTIINNEEFGFCFHSTDEEVELFIEGISKLSEEAERIRLGNNSKRFLENNWSCEKSANILRSHFEV